MENIEYLKNILIHDIKDAENNIFEYKNEKMKSIDFDLKSYYEHLIGYYEAVKFKSQTYLDILNMDDDDLMLYKIKQYRIEQHNKQTFKKIFIKFNT